MNKKRFLTLTCAFLSAIMLMGCNDAEEQTPEKDQIEEQAPTEDNNLNENTDPETEEAPGVDENDTINKDDEKDANPDPEDPVEDPEDTADKDNKDQ